MAAKRHIDQVAGTVSVEFTDGTMIGPIELTATTEALTKMITLLESRLATVERRI